LVALVSENVKGLVFLSIKRWSNLFLLLLNRLLLKVYYYIPLLGGQKVCERGNVLGFLWKGKIYVYIIHHLINYI
jgi:hypothetical protein